MQDQFFNTLGKRIRILRSDRGWTQGELAARLAKVEVAISKGEGVSVSAGYLSDLEKSDDKYPSLQLAAALALALDTTIDYLALLDPDPRRYDDRDDTRESLKEERIVYEVADDNRRLLAQRLLDIFTAMSDEERVYLVENAERLLDLTRPKRVHVDKPNSDT